MRSPNRCALRSMPGALHRDDLLAMIDAREAEAEPAFATTQDWRGYLFGQCRRRWRSRRRVCSARPNRSALRPLGAAYGIAGLLRSIPAHAARAAACCPPMCWPRTG